MFDKFEKFYRRIFKLPEMARIELCSLCNLDCADCYMRKKSSGQIIGNGYLKFDDFKKFLDKNPYIKMIEVSLSGEIFLNPDFIRIIEYAYKKNVQLTAFNGVNFNRVSDEILEALVKYKFAGITFSIDGTSDETYSIYRRNGNYDNVIANIQKLNEYKNKYNSKFPVFVWQFIIFGHNRCEIDTAYETACKLGFSGIYYKLPWSNEEYSKYDLKLLYISNLKKIPVYDEEILSVLRKNNNPLCRQPFISPQINWDGRLLGCCCSTNNDLNVNVFKKGLKNALNSPKMQKMRDVLSGKTDADDTIACYNCCFYKNMKMNNHFINSKKFEY